MTKRKKIVLKLGGMCNLHCKNCHCMPLKFKYNPDIIDWINNNKIEVIHLGGGEPFLYFDLIQKIVPKLHVKQINVTTNGTLLTDEMIKFCNKYNIRVAFSYDGQNSKRDPVLPDYERIKKLKNIGTSSVFYHGNTNIRQMENDLHRLGEIYDIDSCKRTITFLPAFVHQTKNAPNSDTTKEDAKSYILQVGRLLEFGLMQYDKEQKYSLGAAFNFIRHYLNHKPYTIGCRCCNPNNVSLAIDGRFILCPYGNDFVGDIYIGVNWAAVEAHIPDKCKKCALRQYCGTSCAAQITDNECYIFRCLYRHYKKLLKKYNIDENDILSLDFDS